MISRSISSVLLHECPPSPLAPPTTASLGDFGQLCLYKDQDASVRTRTWYSAESTSNMGRAGRRLVQAHPECLLTLSGEVEIPSSLYIPIKRRVWKSMYLSVQGQGPWGGQAEASPL